MIRYKCNDYGAAIRCFKRCLHIDKNHFEAARNLRRIKWQLRDERQKLRAGSLIGGVCLALVSILLLLVIWLGFLYPNAFPLADGKSKIDGPMVMTLTPILLVLIVVAFSLPVLARLKFPGIEAELVNRN